MNGATYYDRNRGAVLARYDALPDLRTLRALGRRFDLILLSAVWMHVAPKGRERAFRILSELLGPSGLLVITLRRAGMPPENAARGFHETSAEELIGYANRRAIALPTDCPTAPGDATDCRVAVDI